MLLHLIQKTVSSDTIRVCYREQVVPAVGSVFNHNCDITKGDNSTLHMAVITFNTHKECTLEGIYQQFIC